MTSIVPRGKGEEKSCSTRNPRGGKKRKKVQTGAATFYLEGWGTTQRAESRSLVTEKGKMVALSNAPNYIWSGKNNENHSRAMGGREKEKFSNRGISHPRSLLPPREEAKKAAA